VGSSITERARPEGDLVAVTVDQRAVLARRYAPILVMHPGDPWMPISAAAFLKTCELWVSAAGGQTKLADAGAIDHAKLGAAAQTSAYAAALDGDGEPSIYAWQLNRPFQKTGAVVTTDEDYGFYVKRPKRWTSPDGYELARVPMYYEWKNETTLCFWFCMAGSALPQNLIGMLRSFFGHSHPNIEGGGAAPGTPLPAASIEAATANLNAFGVSLGDVVAAVEFFARLDNKEEIHQGDWEGATVSFDGETPTIITLFQHGHGVPFGFAQLELAGTRPVLYSGLGSHATVASPATAGEEVVASRANGSVWAPEGDLIRDASAEPWFGFGGAWGARRFPELGDFSSDIRRAVCGLTKKQFDVWEESTGPLGPSVYKDH
jgi:hypothetical protein